MTIKAVIGKNFGDEGKGLAVSWFAQQARENGRNCLVIRHNGGAQAGHTVEKKGNARFVFHQLSAGSGDGSDTLWSETFLPDLFKLGDEYSQLEAVYGRRAVILADPRCRCTCIDDILLNMAIEQKRGAMRHGSCGMGINECMQRSETAPLYLGRVREMTAAELFRELREIRKNYLPVRMKALGLTFDNAGEAGELLRDDNVLINAAERMCRNAELTELFEPGMLTAYEDIIFEGAQGLLLDAEYTEFAPHLTNSRTGSVNPVQFCKRYFPGQRAELVYITRTYVTRHGNGPLPYSGSLDPKKYGITDKTNIPNDWQGTLRFAPHGTTEEFLRPLLMDAENAEDIPHTVSLMLTHIDETEGMLCRYRENIPVGEFTDELEERGIFGRIYLSASRFGC